jgi:hypothetical protein
MALTALAEAVEASHSKETKDRLLAAMDAVVYAMSLVVPERAAEHGARFRAAVAYLEGTRH